MILVSNAIFIRSNINNDFIYHWVTSEVCQYSFKNIISTTAQPKFNMTDFKTLMTTIYSREEQGKTANVLLNQYEIIEKEEKYLEKLKKLKVGFTYW
ncbi:Uncharacterised protein [[Clostridium] sordellii]|uniref:hypothetical protein n=1 Tax=Paraclostridium sordellii TaxID=1505 RepID=UPI0005DF2C43|nr:hypothetical protein [Paeniclostridium sordellii]CEQ21047.1 Uncharacterised protein [[Clostridium] sordellii] [Paeniclostridium sordellii]